MTRKDYEMIAATLKEQKHQASGSHDQAQAVKRVAECFAANLAMDNARFDKARFLAACGFEDK